MTGSTNPEAVDEPTQSEKIKAGMERRSSALDDRIREIVERDQARRPGYDPTIRVTHVDPEALIADNTECADCGHEFRPGEGRWHDPSRHGLLVHSKGGCDRARHRSSVSVAAVPDPAPEREGEKPMETAQAESGRRSNPILDYLAEHGPSVGSVIGTELGRTTGNVTTRLRQMEEEGRVRRTGRSLPIGRGGPQIEWALSDGTPAPTSIEAPEPATVTATRARNELVDVIRADDLDVLLSGYCGSLSVADADSGTLAMVLRVRHAIELLQAMPDA